MYEENKEEDEVYEISDQDSGDDKPQIESIIKEKSKIFQNEALAVKILLTDHYTDFRNSFFYQKSKVDTCVYQAIKREIRNILNTYTIYLNKKEIIPNDLKELGEQFKVYYRNSTFDNIFFINYLKIIKKMNNNKQKYVYNIPKDEMETLNDIERKVRIIQTLNHYLHTSIVDRFQINYDSETFFTNPYNDLKYNYLIIDEYQFSKMDENKLKQYLSNESKSKKLRRPISTYRFYNYLPILCKGSCMKEAEEFNKDFEKYIIDEVNNNKCEKCMKIQENLNIIKSQIKSLYLKTCVFSHNINEIMFHPLNLFTLTSFNHFYKKELLKKPIKDIERIVRSNIIPKLFCKSRFELQVIYNPAKPGMKALYNALIEYSKKNGVYINCCHKYEFKTQPCLIQNRPNYLDFTTHMLKCPNYHSNLERRRMYKIVKNEICEKAIDNGIWIINDEERIKCDNADYCTKFHTRNELFFDERNYRKLYPCTEKSYCEKGELCPKKHVTDINIDEIYLPRKNKAELRKKFDELKKEDEELKKELNSIEQLKCVCCLNFIGSSEEINKINIPSCNHKYCSNCYSYYNYCPICRYKGSYNGIIEEEKNYIEIILDDGKHQKKKKKKSKKKKEEENSLEPENTMIKNNHINKDYNDYDDDTIKIEISVKANNNINININNHDNSKSDSSSFVNHSFNINNNNSHHNKSYRERAGKRGKGRGKNEREIDINESQDSNSEMTLHSFKVNRRGHQDEDEKIEDSKEIRKGKGRVRGSTRKKNNY